MRARELADPSRRRFLIASTGIGGALVVGTQLGGCAGLGGPATDPDSWVADACLRISPEGISVMIPHAEMGQGVTTSLAMLIAEELEVGLDQLEIELAPAGREFDHPEWGIQVTGGSSSIRSRFLPLRYAGASAREVLRLAGATRLGTTPEACRLERGRVIRVDDGRSVSYGELAAAAAELSLPSSVELKTPDRFRLIGTSPPRVDIPGKVDGSVRFGIDTRPADAAVAVVARPRSFGGSVARFEGSAALAVPGVRNVVAISSGIAVVADSYFSALAGRRALDVEWEPGPHGAKNSAEIARRYRALTGSPAGRVRSDGDAYEVLEGAGNTLEASYELPYLAHATMEPMNACADVREDRCQVWAPTQSPGAARDLAVALTGLDYDLVQVQPTHIGGGFGRRSEIDFIGEAVETSMAIGAPVQVIWSREDDIRHGFYRPSTHHVLRAALGPNGMPSAWLHRIAGPSVMERVMPIMASAALPNAIPRWLKNVASTTAGFVARRSAEGPIVEGAEQNPYAIENLRVEYARDEESFVPVGFWRSVGHSHNAFVVESFVDELAHAAEQDPYAFRRMLLADAPRHLRVLDRVARLSRWSEPAAPGVHRGISVHACFGSWVAMVAEVRIVPDNASQNSPRSAGAAASRIRVERVFVAVDCGQVIHPRTVESQVESALAFGLSSALLPGRIEIRDGGVVQENFDSYPLLRMSDMPEVVTELIESTDAPGGVGEIATPPIAPAVGNAVFAATGVRLRSLPFELAAG